MKFDGWIGKKVYVILKNNRTYTGKILEVDTKNPPLIFITILDKYNKKVLFTYSEIDTMQEEE